jgi:hypothetical protein
MGTQTGFDPNAFGPFGALFQNYLTALESFSRGGSGFGAGFPATFDSQAMTSQLSTPLKATARCQLEAMGLVNRRTQAYLQMPTRLAQCRTPQDVFNEQMGFWRTATEQYTDSSRKMGQAWAQVFPWLNAAAYRPARSERDYINFNGTGKDSSAADSPEPVGKQRRVA